MGNLPESHDDDDDDDDDDDVFTKGRPGWDVVVGPGPGVVETGSGGGLVSSPVSLRSAHPCILYIKASITGFVVNLLTK